MKHPGFFKKAGPFSLQDVAEACGGQLAEGAVTDTHIADVRPLDEATKQDVTFLDNPKYASQLEETNAAACFVAEKFLDRVPSHTAAIVSPAPYHSFAKGLFQFYPEAGQPATWGGSEIPSSIGGAGGYVHPSAVLEEDVIVEPGAVVGPEANIGSGSRIAAGAMVGYRVHVGRDCYVGPNVVLIHCLMGNGVKVHSGVKIGQDGFGFAMGPQGHLKVPQIGRVIVQDNVEIGANSAIDRGAIKDTIIGEGSKIDNLVQIGHNAVIGRHCVIVAQVGISGSAELGDFVVMAGHSGVVGHVKIGAGAQIAGASHVKNDVPPGARFGGTPAKPFMDWAREIAFLKRASR